MCGFVGMVSRGGLTDGDLQRLTAANGLLTHRGPDSGGIERGANWALGFRRLAILDLGDSGSQPMWSPDKRSCLVFNGEIYNYRDLCRRLALSPSELRSTGDTEVLQRWLQSTGLPEGLDALNGMFAFAFVDPRHDQVTLVRDRLGVKPLYWSNLGGRFCFASELQALLAVLPERPQIDRVALGQYAVLGSIPPPRTIWVGVQKLEPGGMLRARLSDGLVDAPRRWWRLDVDEIGQRAVPKSKSEQRLQADELDELLVDATTARLVSDVPVGVFLSGGVDSGLCAHYASTAGRGTASRALTATFDEAAYDESSTASEVAAALGLEHVLVPVRPAARSDLPDIAWHCGEPFADSSVLNQYALCRQARRFGAVFISGDGGDEAFAGYDEYGRMAKRSSALRALQYCGGATASRFANHFGATSMWSHWLSKLGTGSDELGALARCNFRAPLWRALLHPDVRVDSSAVEEPLWRHWQRSSGLPMVRRMQHFDYEMYLSSDVLVKVDRASMAHSVEVRSPLLDYRVATWGLGEGVRSSFTDDGMGKAQLRTLAQRHLPTSVSGLPKMGFGLPVPTWMREGLARQLWELLQRPESIGRGFWDLGVVLQVLEAFENGARHLSEVLWRVLMAELWAVVFIEERRDFDLAASA